MSRVGLFPKIGPNQSEMLLAISKAEGGMSSDAVSSMGLYAERHQHMAALEKLSDVGLVAFTRTRKTWRVTADGRRMLAAGRVRPKPPAYVGVVTPPPRRMLFGSTYDGAEMRPQQARPGGNTHTTIPSLISGQRVMRG